MAKRNRWATESPRIIYEAYPDQDLLPIEPIQARREQIGDYRMPADASDYSSKTLPR